MALIVALFWGVFSAVLGFSVLNEWQAWVIIIAANLTFFLGRMSK